MCRCAYVRGGPLRWHFTSPQVFGDHTTGWGCFENAITTPLCHLRSKNLFVGVVCRRAHGRANGFSSIGVTHPTHLVMRCDWSECHVFICSQGIVWYWHYIHAEISVVHISSVLFVSVSVSLSFFDNIKPSPHLP